ncbi:unnamed protein product [Rotaria sordida]|uniref:Smr domain-containing protein n=2 Tax=Rotaria sordida TaxID=392033 RepID=A0A813YBK2_9BILA|nr:unnamed protein product [Rotaria sordida]
MTSLSENDSKNEINIDSKQCPIENEHSSLNNNDSLLITTVIQKSSDNDQKQEELNEKGQSNDLTSEIEETDITNEINNNDALVNTSPPIVTTNEEQKQQEKEATQSTVNHDEHEHGSRKLFNSKFKYSSMPYHRSSYYTNGHPYGPAPYYYYSIPPSLFEKPTPLMFIPTLQPSSSSSSSSPSSSRDNQNGNSTTISPQNLPPRLRQTSITENESNLQVSSTTLPSTSSSSLTTTNGRRHHHYRSILPRGSSNYYSSHLPPPLMATPPGVLYTYPPTVHQPGHIAYNIRPVDEFEYLAFQQQMMNLPPTPLLWPPPPPPSTPITSHGHPYFPSYPINELPSPSAYMLNNTTMTQSTNSFLNPEAAEWIPLHNDNELSSRDNNNNILINDEINFPPLNSTTINNSQTISNVNNHIENDSEQIDASSEIPSTNNNNNNSDNTNDISQIQTDNSNILSSQSNSKIESTNTSTSSSSQDDNNNKPLSSSPIKITPITYSTIISQTSENNKTNKTNTNTQQQQRRQPQQQSTNHIHNQLPPRDRTTKQQQQQRTQNNISSTSFSNTNSHRRQSFNNNRNNNRNILSSETNSLPKQQQQQPQINDDWIEVKSKKTKKFDRVINDNSSEKLILDEQIHKSVSPPLSLTSTGENTTTTTFTSEDDFDEKDHINNDLVIIMDNHVTNDYNQIIVDDIHRRLDNNERLLIIMRGCPGSGKSTLAKSLNHGYNGLILSADDYFTDNNLNKYTFDSNKLDDAHRYTCRRATDALKRNISPIIIDNTNTQTWEMKPYVAMGKEAGYDILLVEPQTPWRYKARELFKRNVHNLPIRRIKEMLNRFEHNITIQSIINQIPSLTITNNLISTEQQNLNKNNEIIDSLLISKKFYNIIDDSLIIDDVRLCINDMILFLTSNFYQTTLLSSTSILTTTTTTVTTTSQPSSPLSVSFHDLSLISTSSSSTTTTTSLPPTPSTSHTRFHRPLTRFSFSSTTNQDHSFNTEHILRIPSSTFSRCIDTTNLTPQLSTQSNIIGKKRRKNKNKQQSNEILLNVNNNNNNNNNMDNEEDNLQQQPTFHVILPEECSDFVVIDENNDNDWIDNVNRNFDIQINSLKNHSSTLSHQQKQLTNSKNCELLNIIHNELNKPLHNSFLSTKHIGIQCSSNDFNSQINHSDRILIGHLSSISTQFIITSSLSPLPGYNECGIQVDLIDNNIDLLIDIYSNHLSIETIQQFYEICHFDIQWTRTQIDEYVQNNNIQQTNILTLQQLCLNVLNQWNEQIKSINPLVDIKSIDDLLQDINDDEIFEELTLNNTNIEYIDINQINIPLTMINSLEELYGELPNKSIILSNNNNNNILLPLDNNLSINIYQALQRFLIKSNQIKKPVIENQIKKKKNSIQQWKLSSDNQLNSDINTNHIPSLKQIMNEEQQQQQVVKSQKSKQKCQLDYATECKLKELERHFPTLDSDLLYDIFHENEYNYEITLVCISKMFDENTSITNLHKSSSIISTNSISTSKKPIEPVLESYENLRRNVFHHAQQRKEFYIKAQQANHHGMSCVASFYIHRASEETQSMKNANRIAYERLLCWKLEQYHETKRIDLHGLHLTEALNLFKQIEQEFNEENQRTTPKSIEIITDYGKNSIYGGGHGKIHSAILAYLQQQNYKYSEPNKGVILLQLTNVRN